MNASVRTQKKNKNENDLKKWRTKTENNKQQQLLLSAKPKTTSWNVRQQRIIAFVTRSRRSKRKSKEKKCDGNEQIHTDDGCYEKRSSNNEREKKMNMRKWKLSSTKHRDSKCFLRFFFSSSHLLCALHECFSHVFTTHYTHTHCATLYGAKPLLFSRYTTKCYISNEKRKDFCLANKTYFSCKYYFYFVFF